MNTPEPLPTPYDITPIPIFAYIPALSTWLVLLALGIVAAALAYGFGRGGRLRRERVNSYRLLLSELASLRAGMEAAAPTKFAKDTISRLSLLLRRYITLRGGTAVWQLSPAELTQTIKGLQSAPLKKLMQSVLALEQMKYAPDGAATISLGELAEIEAAVEAYEDELTHPRPGHGGV
jgi:hypothetical protein